MAANCDSQQGCQMPMAEHLSHDLVLVIFCTAHPVTIQRLLWNYEAHICLSWCHRQTQTDIFYFTDYKLA